MEAENEPSRKDIVDATPPSRNDIPHVSYQTTEKLSMFNLRLCTRYPDAMAEMLPTLADGSGSAAGSSETATATHDGDDDGSSR